MVVDVGSLTSLSDGVVLLGGVSHVVGIGLRGLDFGSLIISIERIVDAVRDFLVLLGVNLSRTSRFSGFRRNGWLGGFSILSIAGSNSSVLKGNG